MKWGSVVEEKYLDINIIKSEMKLTGKMFTPKNFWGLVLIFVVIWVVCSLGSMKNFLWILPFFVVVIGTLICVYLIQQRKMRAIENNDFCLVEDICVSKKFIEGDIDADDRYTLCFRKSGKYVEHHGNHYSKIAIGDTCYLLMLGNSKKIYWVSNKYVWNGLIGFEKQGNVYYPQKNQ